MYSHLPEHTGNLKCLFENTTNIRPSFIGYTHWTEFTAITKYEMTMMDVNLLGILEMERCGINTQGQKNLIIKNAKTHFNNDVVNKLDEILKPGLCVLLECIMRFYNESKTDMYWFLDSIQALTNNIAKL